MKKCILAFGLSFIAAFGGIAVADQLSDASYSSASSLDYVQVFKAGTNTKQNATRYELTIDPTIYGRANASAFGKACFVGIDGIIYAP